MACANPRRGVWGGPPDGNYGGTIAASKLAYVPRGKMAVASFIGRDLWEIGLKKAQPAPKKPVAPTTPAPGGASKTMGFGAGSGEMDYSTMKSHIMDEAKKMFRPEFLNRLDDIVVFRSLTKPDLIQILDLEIEKLAQRLRHKKLTIQFDEKAKDFLVERGFDPQYGARPMRRAVERYLEDPLAEEFLRGNLHEGEPIMVAPDKDNKDKLAFTQNLSAPSSGALSS
jgi:hypothetical protein